ncbi:MAG: AAA family ATPase, partial [Anaerolineae bacterium]|nr:AAA family ATPase [Anaerolineae bacterium]
MYRADKAISGDGSHAICPECGHAHAFLRLPLLLVSGASGAGKSTACHHLLGQESRVVVLDSDILWRREFDQPETHYRDYFELWLRMCKNIGQSGRPVVLFGAGFGVPENLDPCVERRYFSALHYLAFVCDEDELTRRLRARPAWRNSSHEAFVKEHVRFNGWFRANARSYEPPITL